METQYLKTLVVAVETGSFSKTAELLNITQSAVSQRVKFLEERYAHQLLDRSGPVLVPTEVGLVVLEKAKSLLDKERELLEELKRFAGEKRLSICCTPTFGTAFLPEILNAFMLQNLDLADLKVIFHQPEPALKGLERGEFDLAVVEHCRDIDLAGFRTYTLSQDELVFISSPELPIGPSPVALAELLDYRMYARKDGCSSRQLLTRNLEALGAGLNDFRSVVVSDDLRLTISNVTAGTGISFLSRSLVAGPLEKGALRDTHVRGFDHFRCRTLVLPGSRIEEPVIASFLGCLFAAFDHEPLARALAEEGGCTMPPPEKTDA